MAVFLICYPYNVAKSFEKASYLILFSKRRLLGFSHHVICLTLEPAITQQRTHYRICTSVHTACGPRLRVQPRRLADGGRGTHPRHAWGRGTQPVTMGFAHAVSQQAWWRGIWPALPVTDISV